MHPRSRLTAVFVALLGVWVLLSLFGIARGLTALIAITEVVIGALLFFRLSRYLIRQSIWRLRNRLIITYIFIGAIPVALILVLVAMGGYIVSGQVAIFLISSELDRRNQALNEPAQILSWSNSENRARTLNQIAPFVRNHFPRVQMLLHGEHDMHYPVDSILQAPPAGWPNHAGLLRRNKHYFCWAHVSRNGLDVTLLEPVNNYFLSNLIPNLGAVHFDNEKESEASEAVRIPRALNRLDQEVTWIANVDAAEWDKPGQMSPHRMVVVTRPSAVLAAIFGEKFVYGQASLYFFASVLVIFLMMEAGALVAAVALTRTVTGAVHNLYQGTQRVTHGDFSHRIDVKGNDQLATLSTSFNSMTENLERLFHVEKEKERLQSELEIAREVQNQLFPKNTPTMRTMELTGLCNPARMVSGDYYDFVCMDKKRVAFALGDVAGKGISAALLMASIQSIMRTQLSESKGDFSTSSAVALLNRQLYASTSAEKYATFYFGVYDEDKRILSYTNAGHLPPLLFRGDNYTALEVTGTVVGAFPAMKYEHREVPLLCGDLLLAYTDGIAEPENSYGEEFGVERLSEVVLRHQNADSPEIIARVMEAVGHWSSATEQFDDMTILLARIVQ